MRMILFFITFFLLINKVHGEEEITLDLENVRTERAIEMLANYLQRNVVISPAVHGVISLHFNKIPAARAFASILSAKQLCQWEVDNVWFIGTHADMLKYQEEKLKFIKIKDETAKMYTRMWQIQYAKVDALQSLIEDKKNSLLSKRGMTRADIRTNILYVHDTQEHIREIQRLIERFDVPVQQILIEVHLASVDHDYERELGVSFTQPLDAGFSIAQLGNGAVNVRLAALEKEGHGEVISNPSLLTANREPASIESGEEIPYQEISKSGASGVAFKKAVLSLQVTPQIMPGEQILLQVQVNQDKPNKRIVLGVPSITTRQMRTNIRVKSGQTIVLGGIYESNKEQDQQEIPFLGKIPLVGWLFRQQNVTNTKRELLIFVTPKIMIG